VARCVVCVSDWILEDGLCKEFGEGRDEEGRWGADLPHAFDALGAVEGLHTGVFTDVLGPWPVSLSLVVLAALSAASREARATSHCPEPSPSWNPVPGMVL
jgi:hypothetical protein